VRRRQSRRRLLQVGYVAVVVSVVLVAGWLVARPLVRGWLPGSSADVLLVKANMTGFQPYLLRAKVGKPIKLRLESLDTRFHLDGGGRHQFAIDERGVDVIAPPLGSVDVTFTVSEPGTYQFYCSICCGGKANPTMWGRLIVES
jgi:heme/copper-type cytochrome/quinol oxidase subunit 2